jgi:hypothetical protein
MTYAKVAREASRSTYIRSSLPSNGGMTVWALRDLVAALDEAGIPDRVRIMCEHSTETRHLVALSVRHTETLEGWPADPPAADATGGASP